MWKLKTLTVIKKVKTHYNAILEIKAFQSLVRAQRLGQLGSQLYAVSMMNSMQKAIRAWFGALLNKNTERARNRISKDYAW